nr:MAG TPA: hypothetical protein [Inoviridae sp.]
MTICTFSPGTVSSGYLRIAFFLHLTNYIRIFCFSFFIGSHHFNTHNKSGICKNIIIDFYCKKDYNLLVCFCLYNIATVNCRGGQCSLGQSFCQLSLSVL